MTDKVITRATFTSTCCMTCHCAVGLVDVDFVKRTITLQPCGHQAAHQED